MPSKLKYLKLYLPSILVLCCLAFSFVVRVPFHASEEELTKYYSLLSKIDRDESNSQIEYWNNLEDIILNSTIISKIEKNDDEENLYDILLQNWKNATKEELIIIDNFVKEVKEDNTSFLLDELYSPLGENAVLRVIKRFGFDEENHHYNGIDLPKGQSIWKQV